MKGDRRQNGAIINQPLLSQERYKKMVDSAAAARLFTKVLSKPINQSKCTGKCHKGRCSDHHVCKSKNKGKGAMKIRSIDRENELTKFPAGNSATRVLAYLGNEEGYNDDEYDYEGRVEESYSYNYAYGYTYDDDDDHIQNQNHDDVTHAIDLSTGFAIGIGIVVDDDVEKDVDMDDDDDGDNSDDDDAMSFCDVGLCWGHGDEDEDEDGDDGWYLVGGDMMERAFCGLPLRAADYALFCGIAVNANLFKFEGAKSVFYVPRRAPSTPQSADSSSSADCLGENMEGYDDNDEIDLDGIDLENLDLGGNLDGHPDRFLDVPPPDGDALLMHAMMLREVRGDKELVLSKRIRDLCTCIPPSVLTLADDINSWNSFAWGTYLWEYTYVQMSHIFKKIADYAKDFYDMGADKHLKYTVVGFMFPFKIWIWETFPIIRQRYAEYKGDDVLPRMKAWRRKRKNLLDPH
ncbi:hypothetical protein LXL04_006081 [Taraxacum kok-saghyz]